MGSTIKMSMLSMSGTRSTVDNVGKIFANAFLNSVGLRTLYRGDRHRQYHAGRSSRPDPQRKAIGATNGGIACFNSLWKARSLY
jgi:hypothetical protein